MAEDKPSFWSTFPGILTAVGGVIGAIAALLTALHGMGLFANSNVQNQNNQSYQQSQSGPAASAPGGQPAGPAGPANPQLALSKQVFTFPGDGASNNGNSIGPFCCTGVTATVTKPDGTPIGYIYFPDIGDAVNTPGGFAAAGKVGVNVSAESSDTPNAPQVQNELAFDAASSNVGAVRTATVGPLTYTATLRGATLYLNGGSRFVMSSVAIEVDVQPASH